MSSGKPQNGGNDREGSAAGRARTIQGDHLFQSMVTTCSGGYGIQTSESGIPIEAAYPLLAMIHVFLDNAKYHHAKLVQAWLAQPGRRIKLHFVPAYCRHLNPIERLWGVMHKNVTHNKCYANTREFARALFTFPRVKVPQNWAEFSDTVTDNFRVINPKDFRVVA